MINHSVLVVLLLLLCFTVWNQAHVTALHSADQEEDYISIDWDEEQQCNEDRGCGNVVHDMTVSSQHADTVVPGSGDRQGHPTISQVRYFTIRIHSVFTCCTLCVSHCICS